MKIHHLGYAVSNIEDSISEFKRLGYKEFGKLCVDELRNIKLQMLENDGVLIELVTPLSENSPISNLLIKSGNTPYHICYSTRNIDFRVKELRENGYTLIDSPKPAILFNNNKVAFMYHKNMGIIELLESNQ
jgi:methylmalonyl-CoA epimerase